MGLLRKTFSVHKSVTSIRPFHSRVCTLAQEKGQAVAPLNGDPFIGMLETPVTSDSMVVNYLSRLPVYQTTVSPLLRGVEIGCAHGFFMPGPFIKLGPLRSVEELQKLLAACLLLDCYSFLQPVCLFMALLHILVNNIPVLVASHSAEDILNVTSYRPQRAGLILLQDGLLVV